MNKMWAVVAVVLVLGLSFATGSQAKPMSQSGLRIYDTTKLIGSTVKSPDGVTLGQIFDLVVDSQGMWILQSLASRVLKNSQVGW